MNNETITEPSPSKTPAKRTWWVTFNKDNGKILSVTPRRSPGIDLKENQLLAEIDNPVCRDIVKGKVSKNKYAIMWDHETDSWSLDKKSNTLKLTPTHHKLLPMQENNIYDVCDLHVTVFKKDFMLLVNVNLKNIKINMNLSDIAYISSSSTKLLDLYITRKNDPDYLIHIIPIDAEQLIKNQAMVVSIDQDANKIIDWNNVSIYTKPVFKNYGMEIKAGSGANSDKALNKKKTIYKNEIIDDNTDINIYTVNDGTVRVVSNFNKDQFGMFGGKTKFNIIVCNNNIDMLVGGLELDVAALTSGKEIKIERPDFWPDQPLLLHRLKKIKLSYTGEKNG